MKVRIIASLTTLVVVSALAIPGMAAARNHAAPTQSVVKARIVNFSAKYSGTASLLINGTAITIQSVKGSGSASVIGTGKVSGKGSATSDGSSSCTPFAGPGSLTGKNGTINFTVVKAKSKGCSDGQSGPVKITVSGQAKVTGGSGKAKGASGNLNFKGTLKLKDTSGSQSGPFSGTLSGKLTVK